MGTQYKQLSPAESRTSLLPECYICRDVELGVGDPLRNFCDCKTLLAHHMCLSTWIQTGCGSEDRLRCIVCKAKYHLHRSSPWRSVSFQWRTWLVLTGALALLGVVPYVAYYLLTAYDDPPPPTTFKVAAVSFGLLTEILLIKCVCWFLSSRYRQAEHASFTVQARGLPEDRVRRSPWERSGPAAAAAATATAAATTTGHASSASSSSQVEGRGADVPKSGCLIFSPKR